VSIALAVFAAGDFFSLGKNLNYHSRGGENPIIAWSFVHPPNMDWVPRCRSGTTTKNRSKNIGTIFCFFFYLLSQFARRMIFMNIAQAS